MLGPLPPLDREAAESGFAWSWPGAAMQAPGFPFEVANAPGQSYSPAIVDRETAGHRPEDLPDKLRASSDRPRHVAWPRADAELGYDEGHLHHVGPNLHAFLDDFAGRVLPEFRC